MTDKVHNVERLDLPESMSPEGKVEAVEFILSRGNAELARNYIEHTRAQAPRFAGELETRFAEELAK